MVSEAVVKRALSAFDVPHTEKYRMRMMRAIAAALPTPEEHARAIDAAQSVITWRMMANEPEGTLGRDPRECLSVANEDAKLHSESEARAVVAAYLAAVGLAT